MNEVQEKFKREIEIKEAIELDLRKDVTDLKEEINICKSIFKEPKLCNIVMRKFHSTIEQFDDAKLLLPEAHVWDLVRDEKEKEKDFEVEFKYKDEGGIFKPAIKPTR